MNSRKQNDKFIFVDRTDLFMFLTVLKIKKEIACYEMKKYSASKLSE